MCIRDSLLVKLFPKTSCRPLLGSPAFYDNGCCDTTSTKVEFHVPGIVAFVVLCLVFIVVVVYRVVSIHTSRRFTFKKAIIMHLQIVRMTSKMFLEIFCVTLAFFVIFYFVVALLFGLRYDEILGSLR